MTVRAASSGQVARRSTGVGDLSRDTSHLPSLGHRSPLATGDASGVPTGIDHSLTECTDDLRFYEVVLPA